VNCFLKQIFVTHFLFFFIFTVSSLNAMQSENSKLIDAAQEGDVEAVRDALQKGAHCDAPGDWGIPALLWAASLGHLEVVQELLNHGADAHAKNDGNTALHVAASARHDTVIRELLQRGFSATAVNNSGKKPSDLATDEINERFFGKPPQPALMSALLRDDYDRVLQALEDQEAIKQRYHNDWTPLHLASQRGIVAIVRLLKERQQMLMHAMLQAGPRFIMQSDVIIQRLFKRC
jgi:ankyrin repeat protein